MHAHAAVQSAELMQWRLSSADCAGVQLAVHGHAMCQLPTSLMLRTMRGLIDFTSYVLRRGHSADIN